MINNRITDVKLLILGAGMAGLGAGIQAQRLKKDSLILEAGDSPGGLCRNSTVHGCDFDFGPKILLLDDLDNGKDLLGFLGDNYEKYPVVERVYLSEFGLLGFPLQRHLIDLPLKERSKILDDIKSSIASPRVVKNYKDWLYNGYGQYLCEKVLFPYEEKKWQSSLEDLDYSWALSRPVKVNIEEIIKGAEHALPPDRAYYYPRQGNISVLSDAMVSEAGPIQYGAKVTEIDLRNKVVKANGRFYRYENLISTLPLDYELEITKQLPQRFVAASKSTLQRLSIQVFNLVFAGNFDLEGTAIYFPEKRFIFRRVSVLENLCPALARNGLTPISVEISVNPRENMPTEETQLRRILRGLGQVPQFVQLGQPIDHEVLNIDFAYPLQRTGLKSLVKEVHEYFAKFSVRHCGRGGNFDYCNGDVAYLQGKQAVNDLLSKNTVTSVINRAG